MKVNSAANQSKCIGVRIEKNFSMIDSFECSSKTSIVLCKMQGMIDVEYVFVYLIRVESRDRFPVFFVVSVQNMPKIAFISFV